MQDEILKFWFTETKPAQWWSADPEFDALIARRFGNVHSSAGRCELFNWRATANGRLAEIIVLDQFSRNISRGTAAAFENDALALALAQEAVRTGAHESLNAERRNFLYMPYMHSESLQIHEVATRLFESNGSATTIEFERQHREIIERFGRYPHRNRLLGRESSPAETAFLKLPGSSF